MLELVELTFSAKMWVAVETKVHRFSHIFSAEKSGQHSLALPPPPPRKNCEKWLFCAGEGVAKSFSVEFPRNNRKIFLFSAGKK
jgi:hypothetical protein